VSWAAQSIAELLSDDEGAPDDDLGLAAVLDGPLAGLVVVDADVALPLLGAGAGRADAGVVLVAGGGPSRPSEKAGVDGLCRAH
jgi:hypothetical protein